MDVISQDQLPFSRIARELVGDDHGGLPVSLLLIDAPPGTGPGLHTHAYHELFIVQAGTATFTADGEERVVHAGEIVIVPPGTVHRFENTGDGPLRQISIQMSPRFVTEWL
jgi:quercetin dioxygenase-like cupin family protein